jgi:hypothetical protein
LASWFAYELGSGMMEIDPLRLAVYALILLAPVGLSVLLAHAVRQGAGLAQETKRAREMADALVGPTALAANQAGHVLNTLREDIDRAAQSAERARGDLASLREALVKESNLLNEAAELAGGTARRLAEQLSHERELMGVLGGKLEGQASAVVETVERQSRMVADASDLAQTQLREAEAALAARAADLAAAANEAQEAARAASDDLARQTLRPAPASPNRFNPSRKAWASNAPPWSRPPTPCAPIRKTSRPRSKASAPSFWTTCPRPAPPPTI